MLERKVIYILQHFGEDARVKALSMYATNEELQFFTLRPVEETVTPSRTNLHTADVVQVKHLF